jgi:hypothetical protein
MKKTVRNALYRPPAFTSDLTARQYAAIGKVACEWAHLEMTMQYLIAEFTGMESALARKFTADMQAKPLMDLLLTIAHAPGKRADQQPPLWQHLKLTLAVVDKLRAERNEVVHRDWLRDGKSRAKAIKVSARGSKLHAMIKDTHVQEFEELAASIANVHDKLWEIACDHRRGDLAAIKVP